MISKAPIVRALSRIRRQIARLEEQSQKDEDHYDQLIYCLVEYKLLQVQVRTLGHSMPAVLTETIREISYKEFCEYIEKLATEREIDSKKEPSPETDIERCIYHAEKLIEKYDGEIEADLSQSPLKVRGE